MAENERRTPSTKSPLAGCSIVMIGICAMVFLVGFVIWNLFKLDKEISKFTTAEAIPTELPDLIEEVTAYNDFKSRLQLFKDADGNGEDTSLELSAKDINLAIASYDEFLELRNTFSILEITDEKLHIAISFPLRGKPMSDEMRYLNGTMIASPTLRGEEISLEVDRIIVPDAVVPDGFIGQMSPYRISQRYVEDEVLGPWLKRLTDVSVKDGQLVLSIVAAEADMAALPEDPSPYINRFLLVSAACASVFVVLFIAIALAGRKKRRLAASKSSAPEQL